MTKDQELKCKIVLKDAHKEHEKELNAYAFSRINDYPLGKDLVQNTFMKAWKYLVKGGEVHIMRAFLYHILNNLIIDEYRKRKTLSLDTLIDEGFEPISDETSKMLDLLDSKATFLLINRLPNKYKRIIYLRYVKELSLEEIFLATGTSKKTISVQIHRGLGKLKLLCNH